MNSALVGMFFNHTQRDADHNTTEIPKELTYLDSKFYKLGLVSVHCSGLRGVHFRHSNSICSKVKLMQRASGHIVGPLYTGCPVLSPR